MGQILNAFLLGIATWLLNSAVAAYAITLAVMGFTLMCTLAGPFAGTKRRNDH